jgi:hypothetical protein
MARPLQPNDGLTGPVADPAPRQQLPSFSHFLSGVEQASQSRSPLGHGVSNHHEIQRPVQAAHPNHANHNYGHSVVPTANQAPSLLNAHTDQDVRQKLPNATYSIREVLQGSSQLLSTTPRTGSTPEKTGVVNLPAVETSRIDTGLVKGAAREALIEGKGLCYVYEDGSICPKTVGGDVVNPKWGTTKAGKPRKRLGQACNTCREKKIRCDPQVPRCAQCQKFDRECKFETGQVKPPCSWLC